ncbi:MAG: hypothetical protein GF364_18760 [Candidatus Lokiarchaeota archaeon]|nr:hypothetical protein [Candidatus Lokiarchaeota archaeon]
MSERRQKVIKKKAKTIKAISMIVGIIVFATIVYAGISLYSIVQTDLGVSEDTDYLWNDGGTPLDPEDDSIDYILNVTIGNNGIFPIEFIKVRVDVYLIASDYPGFPGTCISGLEDTTCSDYYIGNEDKTISSIAPGTVTNETLTFTLTPNTYEITALVTNDGTLEFEFQIDTQVQLFPINISGSFTESWSKLI